MSITPFEQLIAEGLTGLIITGGQGGNAANIVKRANTALEVVSAFNAINTGNAAQGVGLLQAAMSNADLDPGVNLAVQGLIGLGVQALSLNSNLAAGIPLIGTTAEAITANVLAGITAAANAEIAKYKTT